MVRQHGCQFAASGAFAACKEAAQVDGPCSSVGHCDIPPPIRVPLCPGGSVVVCDDSTQESRDGDFVPVLHQARVACRSWLPSSATWYRHPSTALHAAMSAPLHTSPSPTAAEVTPRSGAVFSRVWFRERPSCLPSKEARAAVGNAGLSHPSCLPSSVWNQTILCGHSATPSTKPCLGVPSLEPYAPRPLYTRLPARVCRLAIVQIWPCQELRPWAGPLEAWIGADRRRTNERKGVASGPVVNPCRGNRSQVSGPRRLWRRGTMCYA